MSDAPPVHYRIAVANAHAHLFEVRCTVADPAPDGQRHDEAEQSRRGRQDQHPADAADRDHADEARR